MISINRFYKSFIHAVRGLWEILKREQSFQIQIIGAILVIGLVMYLPLDSWEKIVLLLLTASVLILEVINSIIERLANGLKPRMDELVREIKDMMAGAVLIMAITACVVALLILWPFIMDCIRGCSLFG